MKEKLMAIIILIAVLVAVLCPGLVGAFLLKGGVVLFVWLMASLLCRIIIGKSLSELFFD